MHQCLLCSGLIPSSTQRCPNCAVEPSRVSLRAVAAVVGLATLSVNCAPVYGLPCVGDQLDGGDQGCPGECTTLLPDGGDPRRDTESGCFDDGGTP